MLESRVKELKEERKDSNRRIKELTEERERLRSIQNRYRIRVWKIRQILDGERNDE